MPLTPAQQWAYWDGQLTALQHGELDTVQKAATGWKTLFAALLGIFTTTAFAGGLTTVDKLASPWDFIVKVATLVAVVAAVFATYLANKASQGLSPAATADQDPDALAERTHNAAVNSLQWLNQAKVAGTVALAIVLAGSATVLVLGQAKTPAAAPTVVAVVNGQAVCGKLAKAADKSLTIGTTSLGKGVTDLTVVAKCP